MTNYREVFRLGSLGINKVNIVANSLYSKNTVETVLKKVKENNLNYPLPNGLSDKQLYDTFYYIRLPIFTLCGSHAHFNRKLCTI